MSWAPKDESEPGSDSAAGPAKSAGASADESGGRRHTVTIPGTWYSFPATGAPVDWVRVGAAPGAFAFHPNRVYGFYAPAVLTDSDLQGIRALADVAALVILVLGNCEAVTDAGLLHLKGLTALRALDLSHCRRVTDAGIAALAAALPECEITIE